MVSEIVTASESVEPRLLIAETNIVPSITRNNLVASPIRYDSLLLFEKSWESAWSSRIYRGSGTELRIRTICKVPIRQGGGDVLLPERRSIQSKPFNFRTWKGDWFFTV